MARSKLRLAKRHRTYTVEEAAKVFGVHRNTVRSWLRSGLPAIDQRRPLLIAGSALTEFFTCRRTSLRRPCQPGQIYCVRCREPREPLGGVVEYRLVTPKAGNLVGQCPACGAGLFRRVSAARLALALGGLRMQETQGQEHIAERVDLSEICHSDEVAANHAKASS